MPDPTLFPPDEAAIDEAEYLRRHSDVVNAIAAGKYRTGLEHYERYGRAEGRTYYTRPNRAAQITLGPVSEFAADPPGPPRYVIDEVIVSEQGWILVVGWADDLSDPLRSVEIQGRDWQARAEGAAIARIPRADVVKALGLASVFPAGFLLIVRAGALLPASRQCRICLEWGRHELGGQRAAQVVSARTMTAEELRNEVLSLLGRVAAGGDGLAAMLALDAEVGDQIAALNRAVTASMTVGPFVRRFGERAEPPKASIVVCLYGRPEYLFVQNALFANRPGIEDCEFIYVCNSPQLIERLLKDAACSTTIYGLRQTVVGLPGNAGFGAANNVGVQAARSARIVCLNPDVFPRDPDWALRHAAIADRGGEDSRLFGGMLFYDDGALMHGGMYFELDTALAIRAGEVRSAALARVEHYGKGAPPDTAAFLRPRPVPAVSGAFLSVERALFEQLGGFSEDYVLGHYEDADLCLRALGRGVPAWVHDVKMWHLEGQGSERHKLSAGANVVNRWLFSRRWRNLIAGHLRGPDAQPDRVVATLVRDAA